MFKSTTLKTNLFTSLSTLSIAVLIMLYFPKIGLTATTIEPKQEEQSLTNTLAQYTPTNSTPRVDNTLGTQIRTSGNNFDITGGLSKGQTLFHSFTDFSIPTNGVANFLNPTGTRDIITRVTGGFVSDINGTLNSNGANFFLINPNGIVFGPNVQLNVGRAFMATTASGINLVDGEGRVFTFGTNGNGDTPLLTVNSNVLFNPSQLIMGGGSGEIRNFGTLQTNNAGQYIGLIGGNVSLNGGQIITPGGRVELGGLSQPGEIGFSVDGGWQFPGNSRRSNILLTSNTSDHTSIDVQSGGGGSIDLFAQNITLQGTLTKAGIKPGLIAPTGKAGDIKIDATDRVILTDLSRIDNTVSLDSAGQGGNIEVVAQNVSISDGARIAANTRGVGNVGNIKITVRNNFSADGRKNNQTSGVFSIVELEGKGKGGNIDVVTQSFSISNSAGFNVGTSGVGDAGNIKIIASGDISLDGRKDNVTSGLFTTVEKEGVGKGGNIAVTAQNLYVTNGGQLAAGTNGKGNAGNVLITASGNVVLDGTKDGRSSGAGSTVEATAEGNGGKIEITARNLIVRKGAGLTTATSAKGNAGIVKITVSGDVSFDGRQQRLNSGIFSSVERTGKGSGGDIEIDANNIYLSNAGTFYAGLQGEGKAGNINLKATGNISFDGSRDGYISGAVSSVTSRAVGEGGNITIRARNLFLTNKGRFNTSAEGRGNPGSIMVNTDTISMKNGQIVSKSASSQGGNINIVNKGYMLMQNNSLISTDSGSISRNGNGGNIGINSPLVVALPGNNDITANAYTGKGGNITINSQGLFGIKYRPKGQESFFTNDITASSTFGQQGTVNIDTPGSDPGRDSTELPNATTDASNQISQVCSASTRDNKLTVTGRGGIPENAFEPLNADVVWQDTRAAKPITNTSQTQKPEQLPPPAVGWVLEGNGKVRLIAAGTPGFSGGRVVCPK